MRRILILIMLMAFVPLFCFAESLDSGSLEIMWNPTKTNLARIGFSSQSISSITNREFKNVDSVVLDKTRREGSDVIAYNSVPIYAFCQIYGNVRFDVMLVVEQEITGAEMPMTVSWLNQGQEESVSIPSNGYSAETRIFSYDTTEGAYVRSFGLSLESVLPEMASSGESYEGSLTLKLDVI